MPMPQLINQGTQGDAKNASKVEFNKYKFKEEEDVNQMYLENNFQKFKQYHYFIILNRKDVFDDVRDSMPRMSNPLQKIQAYHMLHCPEH
jgi:hypothetical protein